MIQHSVFLEGSISLQDMRCYFLSRQRISALFYFIYIFLLSLLVYSLYGFPITVHDSETLEVIYNGIFIAILSLIFTLLLIAFHYIRLRTSYKNNKRLKRKRTYTLTGKAFEFNPKTTIHCLNGMK